MWVSSVSHLVSHLCLMCVSPCVSSCVSCVSRLCPILCLMCVPSCVSCVSHVCLMCVSSLLRVCVCNVCRDVKLLVPSVPFVYLYHIPPYTIIYCRGQRDLQMWPLPTKLHTGWSGKRTCFILYIESRPWAHLRRSWGGHILYRCWFIRSMSTVIILLYTYVYLCRFVLV